MPGRNGLGKFAREKAFGATVNPSRKRRSHETNNSFQELAYSNNLLLRALLDVLSGKGILTSEEVRRRARDIAAEAHSYRGIGKASPPLVNLDDLISANLVAMELLLFSLPNSQSKNARRH